LNAVVIFGTSEARKIVDRLESAGVRTWVAVASEAGLVAPNAERVVQAAPERAWWESWLAGQDIRVLVDASHPSGSALSEAACEACEAKGIPLLRFYRPEVNLPQNPLIHAVADIKEAAAVAAALGDTIFLTTGSGALDVFLAQPAVKGKRVVVRVLPQARFISRCQELGVLPRDIVGLQGPFSVRFNQAIFAAYGAQVVVTREGGRSSGTLSKIKAALNLRVPVVIIRRPADTRFKPEQICCTPRQVVEKVLAASHA